MTMKNKTVVVGLSGGVDSAVAAHILKTEGYNVIGLTMQIWEKDDDNFDSPCCGYSAIEDAKVVAHFLNIDHYILNFRSDFKKYVIDYFMQEYEKGRTPNPCIACNRYIKWQSLLNKAYTLGANYIATGHYATIDYDSTTGIYTLKASMSNKKDQTYALYNLTQSQLAQTLFPLGTYTKDKVRKIASDIGLSIAQKPDSQEICFIPNNDYGAYLQKNIKSPIKKGDFVDINGNILGTHKGIVHYTIGQRKNLGIALGKPMYVKKLLPSTNQVVLSADSDLFCDTLVADDINYIGINKDSHILNMPAIGKIRYSHLGAKCSITISNNTIYCKFETPQRAITPGQAAVFYDEQGFVLCGGTIVS